MNLLTYVLFLLFIILAFLGVHILIDFILKISKNEKYTQSHHFEHTKECSENTLDKKIENHVFAGTLSTPVCGISGSVPSKIIEDHILKDREEHVPNDTDELLQWLENEGTRLYAPYDGATSSTTPVDNLYSNGDESGIVGYSG